MAARHVVIAAVAQAISELQSNEADSVEYHVIRSKKRTAN